MPPTRADYAKINIACKELGLDKYQLIGDRYGLESSKQLTRHQLADLYAHFRRLGWTPRRSRKKDMDMGVTYSDRQHRKVQALWITLGKKGIVRNRGDKAMNRFVKRLTGRDHLRWCGNRECQVLIQALEAMQLQGHTKKRRKTGKTGHGREKRI